MPSRRHNGNGKPESWASKTVDPIHRGFIGEDIEHAIQRALEDSLTYVCTSMSF